MGVSVNGQDHEANGGHRRGGPPRHHRRRLRSGWELEQPAAQGNRRLPRHLHHEPGPGDQRRPGPCGERSGRARHRGPHRCARDVPAGHAGTGGDHAPSDQAPGHLPAGDDRPDDLTPHDASPDDQSADDPTADDPTADDPAWLRLGRQLPQLRRPEAEVAGRQRPGQGTVMCRSMPLALCVGTSQNTS
jgi:hypothetical protein